MHADDFLVVGEEQALQNLKDELEAVHELETTEKKNQFTSHDSLAGVVSGIGRQRKQSSGIVELNRTRNVQAREPAHDCRGFQG